jgi:hypothetical protein
MVIKLYNFQDDNIRLRCSMLFLGIIFIFLGIQGFFDLVKFVNFPDLKLYSIIFIILGLCFFLGSILKYYPKNNSYERLIDL